MVKTTKPNGKLIDNPRLDELIAAYIEARNAKKKLEDKAAYFQSLMDRVSGGMMEFLKSIGTQSARTNKGTVYIRVDSRASLSDPDSFMDFVREHQAFELLNRSANATACREFVHANGTLPPGVNLSSIEKVSVTIAGAKEDNG